MGNCAWWRVSEFAILHSFFGDNFQEKMLFDGNVVMNEENKFVRIFEKPCPAILEWDTEDDGKLFPFHPDKVYSLKKGKVSELSMERVVLSQVLLTQRLEGRRDEEEKNLIFKDVPEGIIQSLEKLKLGVISSPQVVGMDENNKSGRPTPSARAFSTDVTNLTRVRTQMFEEYSNDERYPLGQHFSLEEMLGEGGFAKVYSAKHKASGKPVAVKVMLGKEKFHVCNGVLESQEDCSKNNTGMDDDEHSKRIKNFEWEIRVMQKIRNELPVHPNIVRLYATCSASDPPRTCLVMERLDGGELFDRIVERKKYTEHDAAYLFRTLIRTIHDLHKAGIVHRDLKPENVVFADNGFYSTVKIVDFGTALLLDHPEDDPYQDSILTSPGYSAPEVQRKLYTPACDVWSMGVMLYCLLVGYMPFEAGFMQILKVMTGQFEFHEEHWKDISEDVKHLIRQMLKTQVSKRITTKEILEHPWVTNVEKIENEKDLATTRDRMKTFNSKRKFKSAAMAAMLSARLRINRMVKENALKNITKFKKKDSTTSAASSATSTTSLDEELVAPAL